jgi:hypothetical protein
MRSGANARTSRAIARRKERRRLDCRFMRYSVEGHQHLESDHQHHVADVCAGDGVEVGRRYGAQLERPAARPWTRST